MNIEIRTASTSELQRARNALLQACLRPDPLPYGIDEEYPILLAPDSAALSFCAMLDGRVVGHLNLWPREIESRNGTSVTSIGLIGNVATAAEYRGRGIMAALIQHAVTLAKDHRMHGLVLWSDLTEFYQKFGFTSFGTEWRFVFGPAKFNRLKTRPTPFEVVSPIAVTDSLLDRLMATRYETPFAIKRTKRELKQFTRIPDSYIATTQHPRHGFAYGIIGKGYDLAAVMHEWGADSPEGLVELIRSLLMQTGWDELRLLAPITMAPHWQRTLGEFALSQAQFPVGLRRLLTDDHNSMAAIESCFFWGFDSI